MKAKKTAAKATTKTASAKAPKAKIAKPILIRQISDTEKIVIVAKAALDGLPMTELATLCKKYGVPIHKNKGPTVARLAAHLVIEEELKIRVTFEEGK